VSRSWVSVNKSCSSTSSLQHLASAHWRRSTVSLKLISIVFYVCSNTGGIWKTISEMVFDIICNCAVPEPSLGNCFGMWLEEEEVTEHSCFTLVTSLSDKRASVAFIRVRTLIKTWESHDILNQQFNFTNLCIIELYLIRSWISVGDCVCI